MEISHLSLADAPIVLELAKIVHQLHVEHQPERYRVIHDDGEFESWIASHLSLEGAVGLCMKKGDFLLGYLIAIISRTGRHPLTTDRYIVALDEICVHPDHRRKGIADALLDALKQEGRSLGASIIRSNYASFNGPSEALLKKHGLVAVSVSCEGYL